MPGNPQYQIRPAVDSDVPFLADVVVKATAAQGRWPEDFDEPKWRSEYEAWTRWHVRGAFPGSATSVIEVDGEAVGRLRVVRDGQRIELTGIQLLPYIQGRGIGTSVIDELKAEAIEAGISVELSVELDNPRARQLYERLGFVKIGDDGSDERFQWSPERRAI